MILFGVPLLHRKGVGEGSAKWSESEAGDGTKMRLLEFTGLSAPECAAGLNRFGFIQELSRGTDSIYFGIMTSLPDESFADAKKALHSGSKEAPYSAIEGRIAEGCIETAGARFVARTPASESERNKLIDRARHEVRSAPKLKAEFEPAESAPRPFLHALASLLSQPGHSETRYAYNGRMYRLRIEKSRDAKAGLMRVSGTLRREEGGKPTEFRLWIEEGAARPIPLRIEFQPKPYLRLTFEADATRRV